MLVAPAGYVITSVNFGVQAENLTPDEGTISGTTWTGSANTVTFTATGGVNIKKIIVAYEPAATTETVTVTAAGWATYVTKNAVSFGNCNAYIIEAADAENATLTKVTDVPADTPVLVEGVAGQETTYTLDIIDSSSTDVYDNQLFVVGESDQIYGSSSTSSCTYYVLAQKDGNTGFYRWTGTERLATGKVYLCVYGSNSRQMLNIVKPGEASSIQSIDGIEVATNRVYNLNGQQVAAPLKGLYIVNGKKVFMK